MNAVSQNLHQSGEGERPDQKVGYSEQLQRSEQTPKLIGTDGHPRGIFISRVAGIKLAPSLQRDSDVSRVN